jgi:hypothetical protein
MEGKYFTELAAKKGASKFSNPCIVRFSDGSFDWFPLGHPIGYYENGKFVESVNYAIISRYDGNKWNNVVRE